MPPPDLVVAGPLQPARRVATPVISEARRRALTSNQTRLDRSPTRVGVGVDGRQRREIVRAHKTYRSGATGTEGRATRPYQ